MTGNVIESVPTTTVVQDYMPQSPGDGATDRDCPNCIWHSENGCTVWDCDFISRAEAKKRLSKPMFDPANLDLDQTVYGYRLRDLLIFADACRKAEITNDELKIFVQSTEKMLDIFVKKVESEMVKSFDSFFNENIFQEGE